jgi:hypothetical protein
MPGAVAISPCSRAPTSTTLRTQIALGTRVSNDRLRPPMSRLAHESHTVNHYIYGASECGDNTNSTIYVSQAVWEAVVGRAGNRVGVEVLGRVPEQIMISEQNI